jgi:integrase
MALNRLTAMTVSKLSRPGKYPDGGGLYLQVTCGADGAPRKSCFYRYTSPETGRERFLGYGAYPEVPLAEARAARDKARAMLREKVDPLAERDRRRGRAAVAEAKGMSFDQCADAYLAANAPAWRSHKHRIQWRNSIAQYASPVFGSLPVEAVDVGLVLKALEPIWHVKPPAASSLRGRIESVLGWAISRQLRPGPNSAQWKAGLDHMLPAVRKFHRTVHRKALPYSKLPELMERLQAEESTAAKAMRFLILTAARVGEVTGAVWTEIDLVAKVWTVSAERMKTGRAHRAALSSAALAILESVAPLQDQGLLFPSVRAGYHMTDVSFATVLKRLGVEATTHGFRSSFADWAFEQTEFPRELVEVALSHAVGDATERAYRRSDAIERRGRLMSAWAAFVCGESGGKVLHLRR